MILSAKSLGKLAEMICGSNGTQGGFYWANFRYRSSSYLTEFFKNVGLPHAHNGGTRKFWVEEILKQESATVATNPSLPADSIIVIIQALLDPRTMEEEGKDRAKAIEDINGVLKWDHFRVFIDDENLPQLEIINGGARSAVSVTAYRRAWTVEEKKLRESFEAYLGNNILDSVAYGKRLVKPSPSRAVKSGAKKVTIAIGFSYQNKDADINAILFAADSRISRGTNITNDALKVVSLKSSIGPVLLAKAGAVTAFDYVHEILEQKLAEVEIKTPRTIPNLAEDCIRELSDKLIGGWPGESTERIYNYECVILIGFFFDGKPCIYSIELSSRVAIKCQKEFIAIGAGCVLAEFLLTSVDFSALSPASSLEMAWGIIEMCKIHDASCGGPCTIGVINEKSDLARVTNDFGKAVNPSIASGSREAHVHLMKRFADNFK